MLKKATFVVSIIAFVYFAYLFIMFFTETEFPTVAGAIHEMVMIPLMIATPVFFIIALVYVIKERFRFRSTSFYSLLLLSAVLVAIIMLMKGYADIEM